ncbi:MAG: SMC-Scp complex subunit ScpB [Clostridiales bacterium]|nr:SMC-Scp complex subunit ScpB [Clostridiales bacterium]
MSEQQLPALQPLDEPERKLLAILFAAGDPTPVERLAQTLGLSRGAAEQRLEMLSAKLDAFGLPFELLPLEESVQLATRTEYSPAIRAALSVRRNTPLSQSAMEVLAIIAYNQPVTRAFVEQIRGVDSSHSVNSLVAKGLVEEAGRLELPGRPIAYRTTQNFLRCFGLHSLEELPDVTREEDQLSFEDLPAGETGAEI